MDPSQTEPPKQQISLRTSIWTNLISVLIGAAIVAGSMMVSVRHEPSEKSSSPVLLKEQPELAVETAKLASDYQALVRKTDSEKRETDEKVKSATTALNETELKFAESKNNLEEISKQYRASLDAINKLAANTQARPNATPDAKKIADAQQALSKLEGHITAATTTQAAADTQINRVKETIEVVPPGAEAAVKVFYATDRKNSSGSTASARYEGARGDGLRYGVCTVSLPKDHRMGQLESPSIFRLEFKPDPEKHIVLQSAVELSQQQFFETLKSAVVTAASPELFVFVHGFANSFEDAARRTAQFSYDLGYRGVPMFYSWPSQGGISVNGYRYDETNVDWTVPHLKAFLLEVAQNSGAKHINLVAHSMGNKILGNAIAQIAAEMQERPQPPTFNQVVLTAPDIDADVFKDTLVPAIKKISERVTLYASSSDDALKFSKRMHGQYRRAGDNTPDILVSTQIDSIDVSAVDTYFFSLGHSYFGDNRSVISDLFLLFRDGSPPDKRNLIPRPHGSLQSWLFRP